MQKSYKAQTDNSFLMEKIKLRIMAIESQMMGKKSVRIFEAFGGNGVMYDYIIEKHKFPISVTRCDIKKDRKGTYLCGDNTKFMKSVDLKSFDILDLDAYGIPYAQLCEARTQGFSGPILITHIQSGLGSLNKKSLREIGVSSEMYAKSPILFSGFGATPIVNVACSMGYTKKIGYKFGRKEYFLLMR